MTVNDFIKANPQFKKYKCGYILKSNNEKIYYRTVKDNKLHINLKYYIMDVNTDEVVNSGATYYEYNTNEIIIETPIIKKDLDINVKEVKTKIKLLKSNADLLYKKDGESVTQEWCNAYYEYDTFHKKIVGLYKESNNNIPSWLKK